MINQFFGKALLRRLSTHTAKRKGSHLKLRERRLFDNLRALSEGPNQQVRLPTVSLVGLPNVGKSTLYNRLTRQDRRRRGARAIVASTPQTTRDFRESTARIGDMHFNLVDTGGLETGSKQQRHSGGGGPNTFGSHAGLEQPMLKLTTSVVRRSDVVFLMLDGKHGISVLDDHFARWLRKIKTELPSERNGKRVIYPVINKIEGLSEDAPEFQTLLADAHRLGFGEPLYISAEQGHGFADLFQAISKATEDPTNNTTTHENNAPGQTNNTPSKGKGNSSNNNSNTNITNNNTIIIVNNRIIPSPIPRSPLPKYVPLQPPPFQVLPPYQQRPQYTQQHQQTHPFHHKTLSPHYTLQHQNQPFL